MATNTAVRFSAPAPSSAAAPADPLQGWRVLGVLGAALALAGWTDVALGLLPARPGNPDWEFGAISATLDAMPLGTLGLGLAAAALTARGARRTLAAVAVFAWLVVAALVVGILLYALSAPAVWRAAPPAVHPQLMLAMAKAGVLAAAYLSFYLWLGVHCRRAARRSEPR